MFLQRSCRGVRPSRRLAVAAGRASVGRPSRAASTASRDHSATWTRPPTYTSPLFTTRQFHVSRRLNVVKPVVLADIGEGIVECEIIQWFVQPGARVEEFSPLCEVQSDKASVEITSRFAGVVRKLHYEAGEMAKVGKAFVDIDLPEEELSAGDAVKEVVEEAISEKEVPAKPAAKLAEAVVDVVAEAASEPQGTQETQEQEKQAIPRQKFTGSSLATPAVRHLSKELKLDITQVVGTGKDGRVLKEDLYRFIEQKSAPPSRGQEALPSTEDVQQETTVPLSGTQLQMFKAMTRSLNIPHFLYADEIDFTQLYNLRQRINASLARKAEDGIAKISYLPFVIKAVSMALNEYPVLNARVEASDTSIKPKLVYRSQHNIGIAMDTPNGLIVPVVRNVNGRSVLSIAGELARLQGLAQTGKLTPGDLQGGTMTVSNIGNVGGTYLSPVIVEREVAILGMGRLRTVPAFSDDGADRIVKRHVCHFSFSADHRVVDGATLARAAEVVRSLVEQPDSMILQLR